MVPAPIFILAPTPNLFQEAVISDVETSKPKRVVKRKKYPWVINILKEYIDATTIIKRILDRHVNLAISVLLVLATTAEKQHTKAITEDKAV